MRAILRASAYVAWAIIGDMMTPFGSKEPLNYYEHLFFFFLVPYREPFSR